MAAASNKPCVTASSTPKLFAAKDCQQTAIKAASRAKEFGRRHQLVLSLKNLILTETVQKNFLLYLLFLKKHYLLRLSNKLRQQTDAMKIKAYLKPQCGWSMGVRAIMDKHVLEYEDLDIVNNPDIYAEMVEKSGQPLSPCVEIDGVMLADVSGAEVENYMLGNNLVSPNEKEASAPTNAPCSDEEHAAQAAERVEGQPVRFF